MGRVRDPAHTLTRPQTRAAVAELGIVALLVGDGSFDIYDLVLLLLLASVSLWLRGCSWSDAGFRRPARVRPALLLAISAAAVILIAVRVIIAPLAVWLAGVPIDLSALGGPGDVPGFWLWLAQAWTLAAFGEEMVFRGYLIPRLQNLAGSTGAGVSAAIVVSSAVFGLGHSYQGPAGMIATGVIGGVLGVLYVLSDRNLWVVIVCHGLVDTVALAAIHTGHHSWLFT